MLHRQAARVIGGTAISMRNSEKFMKPSNRTDTSLHVREAATGLETCHSFIQSKVWVTSDHMEDTFDDRRDSKHKDGLKVWTERQRRGVCCQQQQKTTTLTSSLKAWDHYLRGIKGIYWTEGVTAFWQDAVTCWTVRWSSETIRFIFVPLDEQSITACPRSLLIFI